MLCYLLQEAPTKNYFYNTTADKGHRNMKGIHTVKQKVDRDSITNEAVMLLGTKADALRAQTEKFYEGLADNPLHDEAYMEVIKRGLKLKSTSDLFTEEERAFFQEIDRAEADARRLFSELCDERRSIERAIESESMYADTIRPQGESLSELAEKNENDQGAMADIIAQLMETRTLATGIGWERYEALLHKNYRRITSEVRAIVKELKAVTFIEKESIKLEFPKALHIQLETDYYEANTLLALPDAVSLEATEEVLQPLLYHHRKALEASNYSTTFIDTLINSKCKELAKSAEISIDEDTFGIFTTSVDRYTFTKDKVSNHLTELTVGETEVTVESQKDRKKGKEIVTLVTLNFDELSEGEDGIKKLKALDNMDRVLLDALVSVWVSAEASGELRDKTAVTTLQTLYRIITKNPNSRLDAEKEQDLVDRLHKLTSAIISINAEAESKYYKELVNFERSGALVSVVIDRAVINGNVVDNAVYIMRLDKSPLYTYAKLKNQIASVPLKQLDTKARYKTEETIAIERYLISRIESIPRLSNEILINKLFEEVGIYEKDYKNFKKKRSETIKKIEDILKGYMETKYIKRYSIESKGRKQYYKIVIHK